jgi:hypothetical protein
MSERDGWLELTPDDVGVLVSLGQCLQHLGDLTGAKESFERAIALGGPEHLLSMAKDFLAKYEKDAERTGDDFNEVAYEYMVDALDRLSSMDRELKRAVVIELVLLAAKGMAINDLVTKHRLRTLDGGFDGLYRSAAVRSDHDQGCGTKSLDSDHKDRFSRL